MRHGMQMLLKQWICRGKMQRDTLPLTTAAREEQRKRQLENHRDEINVEITI